MSKRHVFLSLWWSLISVPDVLYDWTAEPRIKPVRQPHGNATMPDPAHHPKHIRQQPSYQHIPSYKTIIVASLATMIPRYYLYYNINSDSGRHLGYYIFLEPQGDGICWYSCQEGSEAAQTALMRTVGHVRDPGCLITQAPAVNIF